MSEAADRWVALAQEDLRVAEVVYPEGIYNQVCFHVQQCIEKCLKGLLAHYGEQLPRTHSITELLEALPSTAFDELKEDLTGMDDYYIPTRYPDALPGALPHGLPGKEEADEAIDLARRVSKLTEQLVQQ